MINKFNAFNLKYKIAQIGRKENVKFMSMILVNWGLELDEDDYYDYILISVAWTLEEWGYI